MKHFFFYFLAICLLNISYAFAFDTKDFEKQFKLLPQPQKIEFLSGKGLSAYSLQYIFLNGTSSKPVLYGSLTIQTFNR